MARVPDGTDLVKALQALGVWVPGPNPSNAELRKAFPQQVSKLSASQLGDEHAYWQSEFSRVTAMLGAIDAGRVLLRFRVKKAEAAATRTVFQANRDGEVKMSATEVKTRVDADVALCELQEQLVFLDVLFTAISAVKEAYEGYVKTLSREITRVGDLLRNRGM